MGWYKRDPQAALEFSLPLSLEERGAYITLVDLIHRDGCVPDSDGFISRWMGVDIRIWKRIRAKLIQLGKIREDGGFLINADSSVIVGREPISASLRQLIIDRYGEACTYCGTVSGPFEIDHVHPVARGGSNDPENLTVACRPCNRSKRAKTVDEWMAAHADV